MIGLRSCNGQKMTGLSSYNGQKMTGLSSHNEQKRITKMSNEKEVFNIICIIIGIFIGWLIASLLITHAWHTDSVERGYAEYDSRTGGWQWIEKKK